jgi:dienelactone hydrolase
MTRSDRQGAGQALPMSVKIEPFGLDGMLTRPRPGCGIVIFAHGSGSGRLSPRNEAVAVGLRERGLGTLLFDLLSPVEACDRANIFDIDLLAHRLILATEWLLRQERSAGLPVGYFGASTGAAAALVAETAHPDTVKAVVCRGGRPDLASPALGKVRAPTLLIVGSLDREVIALNRSALAAMDCEKDLAVVEGAGHLFEEPGTMDRVVELAAKWFLPRLRGSRA